MVTSLVISCKVKTAKSRGIMLDLPKSLQDYGPRKRVSGGGALEERAREQAISIT
jgi:hypothetical protein